MNKASFRLAFMAVLASFLSGCASPMKMFAKKPQPFDEFVAQRKAEQARIASSHSMPGGPAEVSEMLHQGHAAFQQGNLQEAQSKYFAVVQKQPTHPVANHRLGVIADRQQDYMTAQRHYLAALNAAPNDPNLLNDIGYSFLLQSRYPEAENYLQGALQKNPKQSNAINNLGLLYAKQGQSGRALEMFRMTNSEAEAQAKVARLMPSGLNPASQPGPMIANQTWQPQHPPTMNPTQYNQIPHNVPPLNPQVATGGGQGYGNPLATVPNGSHQPQSPSPNTPNGGWTPPDLTPPNNTSGIAQAAGVSDPNVPEATRRIKEEMESIRQRAISERQRRDNAERQRQEMLKRQLRDEELNRTNIVNPVYSQPNSANRWNTQPGSAPRNPNGAIVIGPQANPNVPPSNPWQATPDGQGPAYGVPGQSTSNHSTAPPNAATNPHPESMRYASPNSMVEPIPNSPRESAPPSNLSSPLDAMPTWPPPGSLPAISPRGFEASPDPTRQGANSTTWQNGSVSGASDDPSRRASRLGMNAGPGNPFPITPGPSSGAPSTRSTPNGHDSQNSSQSFGPFQGVSPTTPPNWPANSNPPMDGPLPGEPPPGAFGPSNFSTSANSHYQHPESPSQFALQDRLPQSEQFQTPSSFNPVPAGTTQTQTASFGANRGIGGSPATPTAAQNSRPADRTGIGNRWQNGPVPETQSVQTSTPTMHGHLAAPMGENALLEYERWIQQQNAETNQIRQQLDAVRQLPPSENFRRSRTR